MPRVVSASHSMRQNVSRENSINSPMKIPLNDDKQEKAIRFQSRQALHDLQLNSLRAAVVSPMRRVSGQDGARGPNGSPRTPQGASSQEIGLNGDVMAAAAGKTMTPMQRVPILANYEAWIKMATDNKINATNSWNFALIDYFHDMSLLKEGDGVNFQKASCTLDGCVKIYTSRVDSVATETGKLLSGLADGQSKKNGREDDAQAEEGVDGDDSENEDENKKRSKKKATRSSEATLVNNFSSIQLKKFELEFSVDPLFKKASADFDEGGAKGLLLNHLAIDAKGRIVFDSSDDVDEQQETSGSDLEEDTIVDGMQVAEDSTADNNPPEADSTSYQPIDMESLRHKFFPELSLLDSQDICPSLKNFDLGDPSSTLDIPFLKDAATADDNAAGAMNGDNDEIQFNNDGNDDDDMGGFDVLDDAPFGQGGEVWAQEAALESQGRVYTMEYQDGGAEGDENGTSEIGTFNADSSQYGIGLVHGKMELSHDNILSYFDNSLAKNWAGPEHWKIRRVKDLDKQPTTPSRRKEKEAFEIDFSSPLSSTLADAIYTSASSASTITLPKSQQKSKTRNLLPDDKHFNSRQLLSLFLKPKARLGSRRQSSRQTAPKAGTSRDVDEAYWATQDAALNQDDKLEDIPKGDYDADFFQDDAGFSGGLPEDDDEEFADARERLSPGPQDSGGVQSSIDGIANGGSTGAPNGAFGAQLVTQSSRLRPEYVQYARVAKKVDIRRLKDEIWKGMGYAESPQVQQTSAPQPSPESLNDPQPQPPASAPTEGQADEQEPLLFTSLMRNLKHVYPAPAIADLSTSYCFISLLHLANEKGLQISNEPDLGLEELRIRKDYSAVIVAGGE